MAHRSTFARRLTTGLVVAAALALSAPAAAVEPDEVLADPALEARARAISQGLRCLVCQNQSIDDSDAELARDLRLLVRSRLAAGDSDSAVVDYVVSRYGDFVLLEPPFRIGTYALWFGPAVFAGVGLAALMVFYGRRRASAAAPAAPLSAEEEQRVRSVLRESDG